MLNSGGINASRPGEVTFVWSGSGTVERYVLTRVLASQLQIG